MGPGGGVFALMIGTMTAPTAEAACLRALRPVVAGEVAVTADFLAAPCERDAGAALAYDRDLRVARLRRDVTAQEVIRDAPSALSAVRPGQLLSLQVRVGPVTVERQVEVVRPSRDGERVLVRDQDGRVFSAPPPVAR